MFVQHTHVPSITHDSAIYNVYRHYHANATDVENNASINTTHCSTLDNTSTVSKMDISQPVLSERFLLNLHTRHKNMRHADRETFGIQFVAHFTRVIVRLTSVYCLFFSIQMLQLRRVFRSQFLN